MLTFPHSLAVCILIELTAEKTGWPLLCRRTYGMFIAYPRALYAEDRINCCLDRNICKFLLASSLQDILKLNYI